MNRDTLAVGLVLAGLAASVVIALALLVLVAKLALWLATFDTGRTILFAAVALVALALTDRSRR